MVLTAQSLAISGGFPGLNSGSTYLINSQLTAGIVIETLDEGDVESLSFGLHEIGIEEFDDATDVLGALVSGEVDNELEELFIGVFLEGDFLVEDELVVGRG